MAHPRHVSRGAAARVLERVRKHALALPDTVEKEAWGRPTLRVKGKMFAMFVDDHHGDGRLALWLQCTHDEQQAAVEADPEAFFVPPYVGPSGWLGVRLDRGLAWPAVEALVEEAWERGASGKKSRPSKRKAAARRPRRSA